MRGQNTEGSNGAGSDRGASERLGALALGGRALDEYALFESVYTLMGDMAIALGQPRQMPLQPSKSA